MFVPATSPQLSNQDDPNPSAHVEPNHIPSSQTSQFESTQAGVKGNAEHDIAKAQKALDKDLKEASFASGKPLGAQTGGAHRAKD